MKHSYIALTLILSILSMTEAVANCRAEIEGPGENQIGFKSGSSGIQHPHHESKFWALTGPSDFFQLRSYPVRLTEKAEYTLSWWQENRDWSDTPLIVDVQVNATVEKGELWLEIVRFFVHSKDYEQALKKFPKSRQGTCGAYFRQSN